AERWSRPRRDSCGRRPDKLKAASATSERSRVRLRGCPAVDRLVLSVGSTMQLSPKAHKDTRTAEMPGRKTRMFQTISQQRVNTQILLAVAAAVLAVSLVVAFQLAALKGPQVQTQTQVQRPASGPVIDYDSTHI